MAYQSPIQIRRKTANPFAAFLPDMAKIEAENELARQQARKEIAGRTRPVTDFLAQATQSALGNVKAIPDVIPGLGPASAPSQFVEGMSDYVGSLKSPQQQMRETLNAETMNSLAPDDYFGQGLLTGQQALSDPGMLLAKGAGNVLPFAAAGRAAKVIGAGGKIAGAVTNALLGAGAVRGGAYDAVQQADDRELMSVPRYAEMRATMPESEAKRAFGEIASSFEESGGKIALGGLLGYATGALGAEGKIAELASGGAKAFARNELAAASKSLPMNALKGFASEGIQEFGEEGSQQYLSNLAAGVDPMKGVVQGAVEGGLIGGVVGGGVGGVETLDYRQKLANLDAEAKVVERPTRAVQRVAPESAFPTQEIQQGQETSSEFDLPDDASGEMTAEQIASQSVPNPIDDIIAEVTNRTKAIAEQPLEPLNDVQQVPLEVGVQPVEVPVLAPELPANLSEQGASSLPSVTDAIPVGGETLPPTEGVDSVLGANEGLGAAEAQPAIGASDIPASAPVEQIVQTPSASSAPMNQAPSVNPVVVQNGEGAIATSTIDPIHGQTVAQPQQRVKTPAMKGLDRVKVGDRFGTVNSRQKDGSVNISFDDGKVERVPVSQVSPAPSVQPEDQLEVVEDKLPDTPHGIVGAVRNAFPKIASPKVSEEFQKAATAFEADIQNVDKMAAFLRAARGGAFDAVVEAIRAGKDPIKAANRLAVSGESAQNLVEKAKKYVAKMAKSEDVDLEGPLKASIEKTKKPVFSRGEESLDEIRAAAQKVIDDFTASLDKDYPVRKGELGPLPEAMEPDSVQKMLTKALSAVGLGSVLEKAQTAVREAADPEFSESVAANHNGVSDNERASSWAEKVAKPAAPVMGTSKFHIYDFEGDVDRSVIDGLSKITKGLADFVSSTSSRLASAANLVQGSFAGFSPNGNLAGVSYKGKFYINPLKHIRSGNSVKIAKAIVNTMIHEMAHINGFSKHDVAFEAEVARIKKAAEPLLEGMDREVGKYFDKQTIAKLRGLYDTAEKGWTVARQKGRERTLSDERQGRRDTSRPVPSVQPKIERNGSLSPPASEGQGREGASERTGGKTQELGSAAESRPTSEPASGEGDGRPGVLEKPQFARAWHGTPHKFDKFRFDDETRGTGEGAQAYGDGLYFAESEELGRQYADKLSRGSTNIPLPRLREYYKPGRLLEKDGYTDLVKEYDQKNGYVTVERTEGGRKRTVKFGHMSADWAHVNKVLGKQEPQIYHVDIPDSVVDRMLDWDKPLSEQPNLMNLATKFIGPEVTDKWTGEDVYQQISSELRGRSYSEFKKMGYSDIDAQKAAMDTFESGAKNASRFLSENGIPGIKYLDGNSRSKGEGSRNFVVFDANDVTILTRNGEKVTGQEKTDAIGEMQEQHPETAEQKEKPSFAREAEEEQDAPSEITLPEETETQKRVSEFVNKFNRIGDMMKAVKSVTGKDYDIDLEEMAIALAPQTAAKLRNKRDFYEKALAKILGEAKISVSDADKYIHDKASGEDVSVVENDALKAVDEAVLGIIRLGNEALARAGMKIGKGIDLDKPADGLIQRVIEQSSRAIVKAQENVFRRHVAKFVASNPSKEWAINPKNQAGGYTVAFQQDGKKQRIWFRDKTLAKQIENMSDGETSWFMSQVRKGTQMFALLNTRANPVFPIKNFVRDLFFGVGKIYVDDGAPRMMEVVRTVLPAYKALIDYHRDPEKNSTSEWGKLAKLMTTAGGIPEWFGLPDEAAVRSTLERDIKEFDGSKAGDGYKAFRTTWNAMKILSEASEGATRLAYLKTLLDAHMPIQEAIKKTRGVTGDFQRHGSNKNMRYAYAFFNSSIQGAAAMKKLTDELRNGNPRARNLALMLAGIGMSQALVGAAAGDNDDDGQNDYDQLPEYLKSSNLIIPVPGHPIAIPLPYGLNVPIVLGMGIMNTMMDKKKAGTSAWNLQSALLKSFNPTGDESTILQAISPTLLDPITQASENIDSLGRKIYRDRYPGESRLPDSAISSKKDSSQAKAIASGLNRLTGGSETEAGLFDVHPAVLDNTAKWIGGSAARFVKDLFGAGSSVVKGESPEKIPVWSDFVKTPQDYFYTGRFWDQLEEIRGLKDSAKQLDENARKDQLIEMGMDPDRVESLTRSDLKNIRLSGDRSSKLQKEIESVSGKRAKLLPMYEELRKQISALQKSGDENSNERIKELVKAANRKYMEATK